MSPIATTPVESRDFDAAALSSSRPIDTIERNALDLAVTGIKNYIPLLPFDTARQIGCPIHGEGHERRSGIERQIMAGKNQMGRLTIHFIRTADVDTASCQVSVTAAQGYDAAIIGDIASCRIDSQSVIRQIFCRHVARRHHRMILTIASYVERR